MALHNSKMVLFTAVYVLGMLLFAKAQYGVTRQIIVANSGENITLRCNTGTSNSTYIYWVKDNQYSIVAVNEDNPQGLFNDYAPFTQSYGTGLSHGFFKLYIYDARAESAIYACKDGDILIQPEYDVRVIGCSACFVTLSSSHDMEEPRMDVNCHLNNFNTSERIRLHITMNRNKTVTGIIKGSILTFNTSITMMYDTIRVEFNPFIDTRSNIICIVQSQLTTPQSYTSVKLSPSTSPVTMSPTSPSTTSAKISATKSEITISETTSATVTTTGAKPNDSLQKSSSSPIMETSYLTSGTTTPNQTRQNIIPVTDNNIKNNGITTIVIASFVSILIIVFIVIIILVLRLKQRRDRQHGKGNEGEINVAVREQDTCYESIGGSSGIRDGELINNILYESSDEIIQSSISRSGGDQLDTALYTVPDKTGIINRVAKSETVSVSSCGNSSINRHQHEQKEFKQVGAGDDDDTNIPLYAMPDKGPRATIHPMKTHAGSVSTEDGVDIPLYAFPDKRPGSKGNVMKATPGPGTRNEGDEIPLYAVLNKEPGSKDNWPTVKPKPGDQSKALNKDYTHDEEALYADVDKSN